MADRLDEIEARAAKFAAERVTHPPYDSRDVLALVNVARAARATFPPECSDLGCLHANCHLARALARLDGEADKEGA